MKEKIGPNQIKIQDLICNLTTKLNRKYCFIADPDKEDDKKYKTNTSFVQ